MNNMNATIKALKAEIRRIAKSACKRPEMSEWALMEVQEEIATRENQISDLKRSNRNPQPA